MDHGMTWAHMGHMAPAWRSRSLAVTFPVLQGHRPFAATEPRRAPASAGHSYISCVTYRCHVPPQISATIRTRLCLVPALVPGRLVVPTTAFMTPDGPL